MITEINIRKATHADIDTMIQIEISAATLFSTLPSEFLKKLPNDIPNRNQHFYNAMISSDMSWVICVNRLVAGFICTTYIPKENTLHIYEFNVAQTFQMKGLGKQLLNFIINIGRQKGFLRLTLTTFKHVQWNAPFYASNGFVIMDETLLNNRLQDILKEEHDLGFPDNSRCAMQLLL